MISEEAFRKTEGRLYRYYWQLKQIDRLKHRVLVLWSQKEQIEKDLRETNITIEPESRSIDYSSERVTASPSGIGYAEATAIREIEKLEWEWERTKKEILKINAKVREYEKQIADMEYAIELLNEECKQFVELKYGEEKVLGEIAVNLNIGKTTASRRRKEIIEFVAKILNVKSKIIN